MQLQDLVEREPESPSGSGLAPRSLFITQDFPPRIGGAQSYYWGVMQTLPPEDLVIVAPHHPEAEAFDATHPYRVVRTSRSILVPTPRLLARALDLAREHRAEIIQFGHPLPTGLLGPAVSRRTGLPYVVFLGGAELTLPAAVPGVGRALRHVLGHASLLLAVSSYTANQASRQVEGRVRAAVLRPSLDMERFAPSSQPQTASARERLGIRGPLIVCVGRLVPRKGQDRLIDALALLAPEFPDLELALVGGGRLGVSLQRRARWRGVADRVHLLGPLGHPELAKWFAAADLFASPCRTRWGGLEVEGFGLVFAEAALAGLPVMAGRSGGAVEAVVAGDTGLVVNGSSPEEVARGLARLLRLKERDRRRMGRWGRELALGRHDPAAVGLRYRQLLRSVVRP